MRRLIVDGLMACFQYLASFGRAIHFGSLSFSLWRPLVGSTTVERRVTGRSPAKVHLNSVDAVAGRNVRCVRLRNISIVALAFLEGVVLFSATAWGGDIYVTNYGTGTIGEYTTSGGTVNARLVSGLSQPEGIAVSGSNVFVTSFG